ncbi:ALDEHYDE REDUCTASE [Salix purpurea]|uniref:ALDEHYDE REDUCTASE n=1 Tax=Salix purpurea TaxID=77065 RepID=A0A9Q0PPI3_SALPP|nr:ALDEHYDE REDUCTASE [Salix purpurea]
MAAKSHEEEHHNKAFGWAARDQSGVLSPFQFSRRVTGEKDVAFKVLFCGICHSDLHMAKNEWGISMYPLVPGHEIVGQVTEVGSRVEKFKVGDKVGVGGLVGSCHSCDSCSNNLENEHFIVRIPENLPLDAAAPLLCHVAVKFAKAMGVKVTVISTSPSKKQEALDHLGADSFLVSRDEDGMQAAVGTMDGIIDTVSATHPISPLIGLLKTRGKLVLVGAPAEPLELPVFPLLIGGKIVGGSSGGGMKETQEMIDFAARNNITADIEVISMDYVNTAMERLLKGDVRYRFVIDIGNTLKI